MLIKTSELTGATLDWMVAEAQGMACCVIKNPAWAVPLYIATNETGLYTYSPSTDWAQGGPIIEHEHIGLDSPLNQLTMNWVATMRVGDFKAWDHNPLIAAMRCYVASKLGDEVEIPEELT